MASIPQENSNAEEKIPYGQKLFDRPFLWLGLGMLTMLAFYTFWGIAEIMLMDKAPLP